MHKNLSPINNFTLQIHSFPSINCKELTFYTSHNHSSLQPHRERQVHHDQHESGFHGVGREETAMSAWVFLKSFLPFILISFPFLNHNHSKLKLNHHIHKTPLRKKLNRKEARKSTFKHSSTLNFLYTEVI